MALGKDAGNSGNASVMEKRRAHLGNFVCRLKKAHNANLPTWLAKKKKNHRTENTRKNILTNSDVHNLHLVCPNGSSEALLLKWRFFIDC